MDQTDAARIARNFSVMTRIRGSDPKGLKMRCHAFHLYQDGVTTLSSSGFLYPRELLGNVRSTWDHDGDIIITSGSLVESFLVAEQRKNPTQEPKPTLLQDTQIDVLVEGSKTGGSDKTNEAPRWIVAQLLNLVDVPASSLAILSLLGARSGSIENFSWDLGWGLATSNNKQVGNDKMPSLNSDIDESSDLSSLVKSSTRIAILGINTLEYKRPLEFKVSHHQQQGDSLLIMGSPFGALAPQHFFNSVSIGHIANCLPRSSRKISLLLADVRCFPGMEGGLVLDRHASLVGMLIAPLRQKGTDTEIQLVIPWGAIASALDNRLKESQFSQSMHNLTVSPFKKAISSVALITVNGSWASGIILNNQGLILTNAHLLEPWRFGSTSTLDLLNKTTPLREEIGNRQSLPNLSYTGYGKISVRLNHLDSQVWCDASVVYVSKGPLDVALLKLNSFPSKLCAIDLEFQCPPRGATIHVVGHGLIGPRSGLFPSVTSGIISNVFTIPGPLYAPEASIVETQNSSSIPVMLQTTAAVHPGASGGAVVNSDGRLVGLITSNAKHGSGSNIPYMNFSIPCKSLEPVFKYSEQGKISILEQLDKPNEVLSAVWALAPLPTETTLQKPVLEGNVRQSKGSRFIDFLNEKQAELTSSKDLENLLNRKLPSKI
ncbi:protease-like protein [Rhynchospora pubera]|uniref:Protease-like protein n=1 Tax=Rhynchospora pubera TaxID=906938 RepID=A0AAV8HEJ0_9POAL|nr:protease-like protein [Rhynchospora pubera]